ncbi:hypothetical protein J6590_008212 [Homalodisca vitripennis]|nr:hypothetical protein J6590_008212 [Homalodisca vitripennis]
MKICNRTYYGDVGKTYQLNLHKPREERLPFLCHLTFTANGHSHGELVQVTSEPPPMAGQTGCLQGQGAQRSCIQAAATLDVA